MTSTELNAALARMGLSAYAAARKWGVSPRTVQRWLKGERRVPGWVPVMIKREERGKGRDDA